MGRNGTKRLLLVEDDRALAELVKYHFGKEGFTVTSTAVGDEALILIDEVRPDLVILDWMIEGTSGIEVCRRLRRNPNTANLPIMMLTARGEEDDRVRGLETGADDFITKPFSPKELIARAYALLRRSRPNLLAKNLSYQGIDMDVVAHRVRRGGKPVSLGPTEYRLLRHFLENPQRVFSRQQLLDSVWPHSDLALPLTYQFQPGTDLPGVDRAEPVGNQLLHRLTHQLVAVVAEQSLALGVDQLDRSGGVDTQDGVRGDLEHPSEFRFGELACAEVPGHRGDPDDVAASIHDR